MRIANIFHDPLQPLDSATQTVGCRHTNSDICAMNGLPKVCALVRADKLCFAPPQSWAKQFERLRGEQTRVGKEKL